MILAVVSNGVLISVMTGYMQENYKGFKIHSVNFNGNFKYYIYKDDVMVWGDYPYFDEYPTYVSRSCGVIRHKSHKDVIQSAKYIIDNNRWEFVSPAEEEIFELLKNKN